VYVQRPFFENRAVYEIMWKKYSRAGEVTDDDMTIRIACRIPTATNTPSEYGIRFAFPLQQWL